MKCKGLLNWNFTHKQVTQLYPGRREWHISCTDWRSPDIIFWQLLRASFPSDWRFASKIRDNARLRWGDISYIFGFRLFKLIFSQKIIFTSPCKYPLIVITRAVQYCSCTSHKLASVELMECRFTINISVSRA